MELLLGSVGVTRHLRASEMTGEGLVAANSCEQACAAFRSPVERETNRDVSLMGLVEKYPQGQRSPAP